MNKISSPPIAKPEKVPSVQADVLGEDTPLQAPVSPHRHEQEQTAPPANASKPKPAQDENQPGFIGERNLPHS